MWKRFLDWFWIIGTTDRLEEMQVLLVDGLGLNSPLHLGLASNKNALNTGINGLSQMELHRLRMENRCDMLVYDAADQFLSQLVDDYGPERMQSRFAEARARHSTTTATSRSVTTKGSTTPAPSTSASQALSTRLADELTSTSNNSHA